MHDQPVAEASVARIALVGNPNVGKSAIFGLLTGKYVTVSNYPGTTVELTQGNATIGRKRRLVIDTPGINSLIPMSEDERVTRDILLHEKPDCVIQVADAKNLRRALTITAQLSEMEVPFVLALNMADEAASRGIQIDTSALSETLGVEVVSMIATQRKGLDRLQAAITDAHSSTLRVNYHRPIEAAVRMVSELLPEMPGRRGISLMLLAADESLTGWLHGIVTEETISEIDEIRRRLQARYTEPLGYVISIQRLKGIESVLHRVLQRRKIAQPNVLRGAGRLAIEIAVFAGGLAGLCYLNGINPWFGALALPALLAALYYFGHWGTHAVLGIPILLAVLYLTWLFVGSFGAGVVVDFFEGTLFESWLNPLAEKAVGFLLPWQFAQELMVGEYGIITMALTYAFAIVLPIVGAFFIAFGLLEDSGYLPRLAVMVNRIFRAMGLNGKAVLPMVLGLGCDTMATLTARILESKRERIIVTLLLALGIPCSAQLGVILGMLGAPGVPPSVTAIWIGVVVFVLLAVGFLAARVLPGKGSDFILEVPPIRLPQFGNIVIKTLARVEWYIKEAVPLFIIGTLILFTLHKMGALTGLQVAAAPLVQGFLGLPPAATEAFVMGFLRRDYGVAGFYTMQQAGQLTNLQVAVSMVTITLFVPCIANLLVIIKERGLKTAVAMVAFIVPFAFLVGGLLNLTLRAVGVLQ
jgi:ferrous iron transport protein B